MRAFKLFLCGLLGFLLAVAAGVAMGETAGWTDVPVKVAAERTEKGDPEAQAYVSGLVRGAWMSYIGELSRNGVSEGVALAMAKTNCGQSPAEFLLLANRAPLLRDRPTGIILPLLVGNVCHAKDKTL